MKNIKQSTSKGFFTISSAGIIVKILALIYLPILTAIVTNYGNGIINTGYTIYIFVYAVTNVGIPVALSKLISQYLSEGDFQKAKKTLKVAVRIMIVVGLLSSVLLIIGARWISAQVSQPQAYLMIVCLAPTLLFTSISSTLKGFFQGTTNMMPTAISQIIEQTINSILTITFAALLVYFKNDISKVAAGTTLGTSIGALGSLIFLVTRYFKYRNSIFGKDTDTEILSVSNSPRNIMRNIAIYALPLTLSVIILNLSELIDLKFCVSRMMAGGFKHDPATTIYGIYSTQYKKILNLPLAITASLPVALLPSISSSLKNTGAVINKIIQGYKAIFVLAIPSAVGLSILAGPIVTFVFFSFKFNQGDDLLRIGSWIIILLAVTQLQTAILTSLGKPFISMRNVVFGLIAKTVINYYLIAIPSINVKGAIIGTFTGYLLICVLNYVEIKNTLGVKLDLKRHFFKTSIASIIMGITVFITYNPIYFLLNKTILPKLLNNIISLLIAGLLGGFVYIIGLMLIKEITSDDIKKVPYGAKIVKLLSKIGVAQ